MATATARLNLENAARHLGDPGQFPCSTITSQQVCRAGGARHRTRGQPDRVARGRHLAHAHDGPVDAVTSFSQAAGHLVPHVVDGGLWVSVTYNGSDPAHSGTVDPVAAAVRALPRVLGQESPGLRWAAVDLDIDIAHEEGADVVLSEIRDALGRSDTQPAPQVTVRAGTRWTSGTTSWSAAEPAAGVQPRTRALIVGGTGAVVGC